MSQISFAVSQEDANLIHKIVERAEILSKEIHRDFDFTEMMMDIMACHANGCPLKLKELLEADDSNFGHDVWGIRRHIDRTTGKITDFFLPRFAKLD